MPFQITSSTKLCKAGGSCLRVLNKRRLERRKAQVEWVNRDSQAAKPAPRPSFWPPNLEPQRGVWGKTNKDHDHPVPHLKKLGFLFLGGARVKSKGGVLPEEGPESLLPQVRPKQYLGHHFWRSCRSPYIPRLRGAVRPAYPRFGPSRSRLSPAARRLTPPHSKFSAALTHWLPGRRSREATAPPGVPPPGAVSRDSLRDTTSGHLPLLPPPASREGGVISERFELSTFFFSESLTFRGGSAARSLRVGILGRSKASCFFSRTASRLWDCTRGLPLVRRISLFARRSSPPAAHRRLVGNIKNQNRKQILD